MVMQRLSVRCPNQWCWRRNRGTVSHPAYIAWLSRKKGLLLYLDFEILDLTNAALARAKTTLWGETSLCLTRFFKDASDHWRLHLPKA